MKRLLLVGAGHAHAQVLKDWIAAPLPDTELLLLSPSARAPYSGMVPGWLAGTYRYDDICLAFDALAAAAGVRFIEGELSALDADQRRVTLASGALLDYDLLSLNVGSTLNAPQIEGARVLALRPLGKLREGWDALLGELTSHGSSAPLALAMVGGGAAGVESLLAVLAHLRGMAPTRAIRARLIDQSPTLLPGAAAGAVRAARAALDAAGVTVQLGSAFRPRAADTPDVLLWAAGAEAHAWQRRCGLAVSERGFIRVDAQLRSLSHPEVHAVGDCAGWAEPLPKAGVYAVRMGPVLSRNLRAALGVGEPQAYVPQRRVLALLATADGSAIAAWGPWALQGRWAWRLKDRIDRAFVQRFSLPQAVPQPAAPPDEASA